MPWKINWLWRVLQNVSRKKVKEPRGLLLGKGVLPGGLFRLEKTLKITGSILVPCLLFRKREKLIRSEAGIPDTAISEVRCFYKFLSSLLELCFVLVGRRVRMNSEIQYWIHTGGRTNTHNHKTNNKNPQQTTNKAPEPMFCWVFLFVFFISMFLVKQDINRKKCGSNCSKYKMFGVLIKWLLLGAVAVSAQYIKRIAG